MDDEEKKPPGLTPLLIEIALAVIVLFIVLALIGAYIQDAYDRYVAIIEWFMMLWSRVGLVVVVAVMLCNIFLVGFIMVTLRKFYTLNVRDPTFIVPGAGPRKVRVVPLEVEVSEEWRATKQLAESSNPSDWNMAILRADAMLDDVLQHLGHEGNTVKERMDVVDPTQLLSRDRVYSAHRLRNMVAHDPTSQHTKETIDYALASYETAFRELGVLKKDQDKEADKEGEESPVS